MTYVSTIQLYDQLSEKIGKDGAEALIQYVEMKIKEAKSRAPLLTKGDCLQTVSSLELKISESKAEVFQWMLILWVAHIVILFFILLFR